MGAGASQLNQMARMANSDQGFWEKRRIDILTDIYDATDMNALASIAAGTAVNAGAFAATFVQGTAHQGLEVVRWAAANVSKLNIRGIMPDNLAIHCPVIDAAASNARKYGSQVQLWLGVRQISAGAPDAITLTCATRFSRVNPSAIQARPTMTGTAPTSTAIVIPAGIGVQSAIGVNASNGYAEMVFDFSGCFTAGNLCIGPNDIVVAGLTPSAHANDTIEIDHAFWRYRVNVAPTDQRYREGI